MTRAALGLGICACLMLAGMVVAETPRIVIDGSFDDWRGQIPVSEDPFDAQQEEDALNQTDALNINNAEPTDRNPNLFAKKVPAIASDPESVDVMIASKMSKLSVDDREKVYLDVHGVPSDCVTETPELIHLSLLDLQNEIELLPDKQAYNLAERLSSEFVHDRSFRLAFLRCDMFDCQKAALRIVRHFQMKLDLFGVEKLVLHIVQDDLDAEGMESINWCGSRITEKLDRAGRRISLLVTVPREFKVDSQVSTPTHLFPRLLHHLYLI